MNCYAWKKRHPLKIRPGTSFEAKITDDVSFQGNTLYFLPSNLCFFTFLKSMWSGCVIIDNILSILCYLLVLFLMRIQIYLDYWFSIYVFLRSYKCVFRVAIDFWTVILSNISHNALFSKFLLNYLRRL